MTSRKGFGSDADNTRDQIRAGFLLLLNDSYNAAKQNNTIQHQGTLELFTLIDHPSMRVHSWWKHSIAARTSDGRYFLPLETFANAVTGSI